MRTQSQRERFDHAHVHHAVAEQLQSCTASVAESQQRYGQPLNVRRTFSRSVLGRFGALLSLLPPCLRFLSLVIGRHTSTMRSSMRQAVGHCCRVFSSEKTQYARWSASIATRDCEKGAMMRRAHLFLLPLSRPRSSALSDGERR